MATMQDFSGLLFGGGGTGLEGYITPEQQQAIQQQSMLQAASALLSAGGPSRTPISLGQALGGALQAGAQGYQQAQQGAVQSLVTGQKLREAKLDADIKARLAKEGQQQAAEGVSPEDAKFNTYMRYAEIYAGSGRFDEAKKLQDLAYQIKPRSEVTGDIFKTASGEYVQRTKTGQFIPVSEQFTPIEKPMGQPIKVTDSEGKQILVNQMSDGTFKTVQGYGPARELIQVDRGGLITFMDKDKVPAGTSFGKTLAPQIVGGAEAGGYFQVGGGGGGVGGAPRPAGAPSAVAPTGGAGAPQAAPTGPQPMIPIIPLQGKVFGNEKDLRTEFQAQVKPYVELGQAYQKIETAAKNPSAAGDIALVYGFMKVLDPGSVVREGEFATAQNAGGIPDTVRNLYNKALDGQRLGEKIRSDFLQQARNLVESQRVMSNDLMTRYTDVAKNYKLDPNQVVFDPFKRIQTPEQIIQRSTNQPIPTNANDFARQFGLTPRNP